MRVRKLTIAAMALAAGLSLTACQNDEVQVTGVFDAQEPWEWTDPADSAKTETRYGRLHLYVGEFDQPSETASGFTTPQYGAGALAVGRGSRGGTTGHHLPGALEELRVWTGAMSADQVRSQVLGGV